MERDSKLEESTTEHVEHSASTSTHDISALANLETPQTDFTWSRNVCLNLGAVLLSWFAAAWASAVASSSLAYIANRFPASASQIAWVSTAPYVVVTVFQVPVGEISDLIGRQMFVLFCLASGLVGSIITGRGDSFAMVIAGQCLSGIALVLAYLPAPLAQEMVPKEARPIVGGVSGIVVGASYITGPIVQGVLIKRGYGGVLDGWRVGFYINAGLYALAMVCVASFYRPGHRPNPLKHSRVRRLLTVDWFGLFLLAGGLAMFLVGLSAGGTLKPWKSATVIALMTIGGLMLVAMVIWVWKITSEGIIPHCLFTHRNFGLSLVVRAIGNFAQIGCQAYLPQLTVRVFTSDGVLQAVWQLPFSVGLILGGVVTGGALYYTKEVRWLAVLSMALIVLGAGLLVLIEASSPFVVYFWPTALVGLGIGIEAQLMNIVAGLCTPDPLIATAIMVASLSGTFAGSIGLTMFGQIFNSKFATLSAKELPQAAVAAGFPAANLKTLLEAFATQNPAAIAAVPGATPAVIAALDRAFKVAFTHAFHYICYALMAFAATALIASCFFKTTRSQFTRVVASAVREK